MISLREFAYEIRQRIDDGRTSEAIPLAQYLLHRHPRYLRGYQLLAEAALEEGSLSDAIEIFSRVMSADPESFAAHAGLASAYTNRGELENALWHMTRAFELEPGMKAVRDQLRDLYEQRDGRAPGRLHLNRAALARNYLRSGAYDAAAEELIGELEQDPQRIDLRVALAEAYWFEHRLQEAAQMAYAVLDELPLAFKPHLILASFYYQAGEMEKAETHLRIAQDLDPENEIAISIFGEAAPFRAIAIPIDEPEHIDKGIAARGVTSQLPEWLRDLSLFTEPEAPTEGVDWEAVIDHEDDWRTRLAEETRTQIRSYKPNWRAGLHLATMRALRDRETVPQAPAETLEPQKDWREPLLADTLAAVTPVEAPSETAHTYEPGAITETISLLPPEWKAALRFATEELIAPSGTTETVEDISQAGDVTADLPYLEPVTAAGAHWVAALRNSLTGFLDSAGGSVAEVSQDEVVELEEISALPADRAETVSQPSLSPVRFAGRWIPTLRVATEIWVAMQRRGTRRDSIFDDRAATPRATPSAADDRVEPSGTMGVPALEAKPFGVPEHFADPTVARVEAEQEDTHAESVPGQATLREESENAGAGDAEILDAGSTMTPEILTQLTDSAEHYKRGAPDVGEDAPDDFVATDDVSSEGTPLDEARQAWQSGEAKEAMGRYQMMFYEESVPDAELSAALTEWVDAESAPALLFQLLGDVYRRMGRMQDALRNYREAINRM